MALPSPLRILMLILVPIISLASLVPSMWLLSHVMSDDAAAWSSLPVTFLLVPYALLRWLLPPGIPPMDLEEERRLGRLTTQTYVATEAVRFDEAEDEGEVFALSVGARQTLILQEQMLYEPVETGRFPSTRFEVDTHVNAGVVEVRCLGEPLPYKTLPSFPEEGFDEWPGSGELIELPLAEAIAKLMGSTDSLRS